MIQSIADFSNSENCMPHGHCVLRQPDMLWLHVPVAACFSVLSGLPDFIGDGTGQKEKAA
jgi:hypothetical protein